MRHSPHQLISGRGAPRTMVPHATVRGHRAPRRTGPISTEAYCSHSVYRSHIHLGNGMFLSSAWRAILFTLELCALGDDAGLEIAPERDQQLAGNCNDGDALNAALKFSHTVVEPGAQRTVKLVPHPEPSELNHGRARLSVAGPADALIARHRTALKVARRQTNITAELLAVVESSVEHFAHEDRGKLGPDGLESDQITDLFCVGVRGPLPRRRLRLGGRNGIAFRLDCLDHPEDEF